MSDFCFLVFLLMFLAAIPHIFCWIVDMISEGQKEKLKRENPSAWEAQERVRLEEARVALEKQRLAAQIEQAENENRRQNIGAGFHLGRALGWW